MTEVKQSLPPHPPAATIARPAGGASPELELVRIPLTPMEQGHVMDRIRRYCPGLQVASTGELLGVLLVVFSAVEELRTAEAVLGLQKLGVDHV